MCVWGCFHTTVCKHQTCIPHDRTRQSAVSKWEQNTPIGGTHLSQWMWTKSADILLVVHHHSQKPGVCLPEPRARGSHLQVLTHYLLSHVLTESSCHSLAITQVQTHTTHVFRHSRNMALTVKETWKGHTLSLVSETDSNTEIQPNSRWKEFRGFQESRVLQVLCGMCQCQAWLDENQANFPHAEKPGEELTSVSEPHQSEANGTQDPRERKEEEEPNHGDPSSNYTSEARSSKAQADTGGHEWAEQGQWAQVGTARHGWAQGVPAGVCKHCWAWVGTRRVIMGTGGHSQEWVRTGGTRGHRWPAAGILQMEKKWDPM